MVAIVGLLYFVLFLVFMVAGLFIIFHVIRYSLYRGRMVLTLAIFISVFTVLMVTNVILFLSVEWNKIFDFM